MGSENTAYILSLEKQTVSKILFINPISTDIVIYVMEESFCQEEITLPKWDDFSTFPSKLVDLVDLHKIEEVWCICGPWAFTRMRIVTLTLNTLKLSRWIGLKGCHFFDLIGRGIPILKANDREYITRIWNEDPSLILKEEIPEGEYMGYGEKNDFTDTKVFIQYSEDFTFIYTLFQGLPLSPTLSPIYLKDPHITWSKKNISHS